jgi:hypothetical protein
MARGLWLLTPLHAVCKQGLAVHHERGYMREIAPQLVEDRKSVG